MNRNLIKQIGNEWRENMWLCIELLIVSVAVWAISLMLFTALRPTFEEKGYDITDVYRININTIDTESPEYVAPQDATAEKANDVRALLSRIHRSPHVELAGLSSNALPYQFSYMGNQLHFKGLPDSIAYSGNVRQGSPEIAEILRYRSKEYSPKQLEEIMRKNEWLISDAPKGYLAGDKKLKITEAKSLMGQIAHFGNPEDARRIGGVIAAIKRNEYEYKGGNIIVPIDESIDNNVTQAQEIAILVKPGMGKKFEDEFYSSPDMRRLRNVYLTELTEMQQARKANQRRGDTQVRLWVSGIVFLLIIIFLGLLGTFWFRIRQRTGEIALRKTCGATSSDVFRRIISEGLLLLLFISIPALIADGLLAYYLMRDYSFSMTDYNFSWIPTLTAYLISMALLVIMIIIGVWFPARQAMKIEPAIALKDE